MSDKYTKVETEFKIGNTTFDTLFSITIPDYGVSIPECHSSGPIIYPIKRPLSDIVNMIERGLHVQFEEKDAPERIFFFIKKYNEVASEANAKCGMELNPIISTTLEYIKLKLRYLDDSKEKEVNENNPFTKKILSTSSKNNKGNRYNNETISNTFKRNKSKKNFTDNRTASEHKMFEMFSDESFISSDGALNIGDNVLDPSPNIPNFYEDIVFNEDGR